MLEENRIKSIDICGDHTIICCTFLRNVNIDQFFWITLNIQKRTEYCKQPNTVTHISVLLQDKADLNKVYLFKNK